MKGVSWSLVILNPSSACLGTHAAAEDTVTKREAVEERRLAELREKPAELRRREVLNFPEQYCLAGSSCAEHPEFDGPPACLASNGLGVCDSSGTIELAN